MFEDQLKAVLQRLNSLGLNVTRESILKDIQAEIKKQLFKYNFDIQSTQPICPFCGSLELLKYKYGETTSQIDKSIYIPGGFIINGHNPKYKCKKCEKDIYLEDIENSQHGY